jgi:hypothetical protein
VSDLYHRLGGLYGQLGLGQKIGLALGMSLVTTLVGMAIIVALPADHFSRVPDADSRRRHPLLHWGIVIVKNAAGLAVLPLAIVTLIGPGPGLVFTLIAFSLLDIPGKRNLERKLLTRPSIIRSINDLRARVGRPPLVIDPR